MIKLYCDRCGKEVYRFNERRYKPIDDAANSDDIFFAVSVYTKFERRPFNTGNRIKTKPVDDAPADIQYEYNAPDLCIDCMRAINNAVKTVWDGKSKVLVREIYGVCDDKKEGKINE